MEFETSSRILSSVQAARTSSLQHVSRGISTLNCTPSLLAGPWFDAATGEAALSRLCDLRRSLQAAAAAAGCAWQPDDGFHVYYTRWVFLFVFGDTGGVSAFCN